MNAPGSRADRVLEGEIRIPYRWTPGEVAAACLASIRDEGRMLGARCADCGIVRVPPRDVCPVCLADFRAEDLVPVGPDGVVTAFSIVGVPTWNQPAEPPWAQLLVRLDDAGTDLVHWTADADFLAAPAIGRRIRPVFRLDLPGEPGEPIGKLAGEVAVPYRWSFGPSLERYFDGTRMRRILGARCTACARVIAPPAPFCGACYAPTEEELVEVGPAATVTGFTTVELEFPGQPKEPPYTYAHLRPDGASTELFGVIEGCDPSAVHVGMRVEPVWNPAPAGDFHDIACFRPLR